MNFNIKKAYNLEGQPSIIILADKPANLPADLLTQPEIDYITILYDVQKKNQFEFNRLDHWIFVQLLNWQRIRLSKEPKICAKQVINWLHLSMNRNVKR